MAVCSSPASATAAMMASRASILALPIGLRERVLKPMPTMAVAARPLP
jgi:hypothetical protein